MTKDTTTTVSKTFWESLIPVLVGWLVQVFGEKYRPFFETILLDTAKEMETPEINVGAAPDDMKYWVKSHLRSLVEKAFASRPFLKRAALLVVSQMSGSFLDGVWDAIFAPQIKAGVLPSMSHMPVSASAPAKTTIAEQELKDAQHELGFAFREFIAAKATKKK